MMRTSIAQRKETRCAIYSLPESMKIILQLGALHPLSVSLQAMELLRLFPTRNQVVVFAKRLDSDLKNTNHLNNFKSVVLGLKVHATSDIADEQLVGIPLNVCYIALTILRCDPADLEEMMARHSKEMKNGYKAILEHRKKGEAEEAQKAIQRMAHQEAHVQHMLQLFQRGWFDRSLGRLIALVSKKY